MLTRQPLKRGAEQAGFKADAGNQKRQKGPGSLSEVQLLKRRIRRQKRLVHAYEAEGWQLCEELKQGYCLWRQQTEQSDGKKVMDKEKPPEHHAVDFALHEAGAAVPKVCRDPQGSQHKPNMATNNVNSPSAPKPSKLPASQAATALTEPGQALSHLEPHESTTAAPLHQSGHSISTPEDPGRKQNDVAHLHAQPMFQESRGSTEDQPDPIPARPGSAFAAMAGRALDASGSLSGSFSRELPHKASAGVLLKGAGSSGRRLQSFDSALSSDSRFEGLQQAACADTSSSEDEAGTPGAHGRKPGGQDPQEHADASQSLNRSKDQATFQDQLPAISRREQGCSVASARELDKCGALAALCGDSTRFLLHRTAVSIGRTSDLGQVDLDLGKERHGVRVCRKQAQLDLKPDGRWRLTNTGRRCVHVNGNPCCQGQSVRLHHLSLVQMGGLHFMFMENQIAVRRVVSRTATLAL